MQIFSRFAVLFSLVASSVFAYSPLTLFTIDAATRGAEIANLITGIINTNVTGTSATKSEVAIQTNITNNAPPYVSGGLIPYVQSASLVLNGTALIIGYQPVVKSGTATLYVLVFVEQIVDVIYSLTAIGNGTFNSTFASSILPLIEVDPVLRAADIATAATSYLVPGAFVNTPKVYIQTTLTGPYYPSLSNGLISNIVTAVVSPANSSFLEITYYSPQNRSSTNVILVSAEQVQQVIFSYQ